MGLVGNRAVFDQSGGLDPNWCTFCGAALTSAWTRCGACHIPFEQALADRRNASKVVGRDLVPPTAVPTEAVVVWSYPGRTQLDAGQLFARHASEMAGYGYFPMSQSWADGRPGLARVFLVGLAASSLRPHGFLTVTYQRRDATPVPNAPDPLDQLKRLGELRDAGVISDAEFAAKKADILTRI